MALTFRDIDKLVARYPGCTAILISRTNFATLTAAASSESGSRAGSEEGGKKVRYVAANQPTVHNLFADASVTGDDIIIRT